MIKRTQVALKMPAGEQMTPQQRLMLFSKIASRQRGREGKPQKRSSTSTCKFFVLATIYKSVIMGVALIWNIGSFLYSRFGERLQDPRANIGE